MQSVEKKDYKIEVRLLSEAIFSSGEGERNLVHSKVLADRHGFVYLHAKTLKGQLKQRAFWLWNQYRSCDEQRADEFLESTVRLFGINNEERKFYGVETGRNDTRLDSVGIMKLGHLQLDEKIRSFFLNIMHRDKLNEYYTHTHHDLIEAQTHVRTSIQVEDGVVVERRITNYHTVKKGLIFYSTLWFDEDPSRYLSDLNRIIRSFRRIGAGTHRGRGKIEARLLIDGKEGEFDDQVSGH